MRWLIREIRIFFIGLALFAFGTLVVAFGVYLGTTALQRSQNEEAKARYTEIQSMVHQETEELKQQVVDLRNDLNTLIESQGNISESIGEIQKIKPSLEDRIDAVESQLAAFARQANLEAATSEADQLNRRNAVLRQIRQRELQQMQRIEELQTGSNR